MRAIHELISFGDNIGKLSSFDCFVWCLCLQLPPWWYSLGIGLSLSNFVVVVARGFNTTYALILSQRDPSIRSDITG